MNCKWFGEEEEELRQIYRHRVSLGPGLIAYDMLTLGLSRLSEDNTVLITVLVVCDMLNKILLIFLMMMTMV